MTPHMGRAEGTTAGARGLPIPPWVHLPWVHLPWVHLPGVAPALAPPLGATLERRPARAVPPAPSRPRRPARAVPPAPSARAVNLLAGLHWRSVALRSAPSVAAR